MQWLLRVGRRLPATRRSPPSDAALAYNFAAHEYFGEFAYLNDHVDNQSA
jgi:hypothetical protein